MSKDEGAVTVEQMQTLTLFKNPLTYAIEMSREDAKPLVDMGLLEWLPPMWGNTPNYGITEAGRALLTARDAQ